MADKIIHVSDIGDIAFPDTMSDGQISAAIAQHRSNQGAPPSINPSTLNTQPISDAASGLVNKIKSAASNYGNKIQSVMGAPDATQGWADIQDKIHQPVDPMGMLTQGSPVGAAEAMAPLVGKVLQGAEEAPEAVTRIVGGKPQVLKTVPLDDISGDPGNKIYPQVVAKYQKQGYTEPPELRLSDTSNPDTPTKYTIQEGHHRILADAKNGADSVQAWVPQENSNLDLTPSISSRTTQNIRYETIVNPDSHGLNIYAIGSKDQFPGENTLHGPERVPIWSGDKPNFDPQTERVIGSTMLRGPNPKASSPFLDDDLSPTPQHGQLGAGDVTVAESARRQGIATKMYDEAKKQWENITGLPTEITRTGYRTEAGKAFRKSYDNK